jgi:hypothetical protein
MLHAPALFGPRHGNPSDSASTEVLGRLGVEHLQDLGSLHAVQGLAALISAFSARPIWQLHGT